MQKRQLVCSPGPQRVEVGGLAGEVSLSTDSSPVPVNSGQRLDGTSQGWWGAERNLDCLNQVDV